MSRDPSPDDRKRTTREKEAGGGPDVPPERAWRESFNAFERAIGGPMEEFLQSDAFADAAATFFKQQAALQRQAQSGSQTWLKAWNVASAQDVHEIAEELAKTRSELARVVERIESLEKPEGPKASE